MTRFSGVISKCSDNKAFLFCNALKKVLTFGRGDCVQPSWSRLSPGVPIFFGTEDGEHALRVPLAPISNLPYLPPNDQGPRRRRRKF